MLNAALPEALALGASLLAVAWDLRTGRIPNWLTLGTAVFACSLHLALACTSQPGLRCVPAGLGPALAGGGVLLLGFGLLSALGMLGFGDAKLLGAIGLCLQLPLALRVFICVVLSGGVLAAGYALGRGQTRAVWRNLGRVSQLHGQRVDEGARDLHLFPYAAAIALGTAWAIVGAHVPALALF